MDAKERVVDESAKAQIIENIRAVAPDVDRTILPQALVVEAIHLGDLSRLVVAADKRDAVRVTDFKAQKKQESLHAADGTESRGSQRQQR